MNITEAVANWMDTNGFGNLGTDLYIGVAPLGTPNVPDAIWWVVGAGGVNQVKAATGNKLKNYTVSVYYRSTNAQNVYDRIQDLETAINSAGCITLTGYDVVEVETVLYPADQDIDNEDRTVALLEVMIRTYL